MKKNSFEQNKYILIENAIEKNLKNFITQYALFDEMQNFMPEKNKGGVGQVPNAHSKYADPAMESLLLQLLPLMQEKTNLKLYPTYSYYRVYRKGDILLPHTDRPSCEISTTVCLNYSYDPEEYSWPIIMDKNTIHMKSGDIVVYRGIDLEHSRDEFMPPYEDDWHVQAFLHYVDANGPYSEYKYDKRNSVGETPSLKNKINKRYITFVEDK
jgi:hypothetical protein